MIESPAARASATTAISQPSTRVKSTNVIGAGICTNSRYPAVQEPAQMALIAVANAATPVQSLRLLTLSDKTVRKAKTTIAIA